MEPEGSLLCSLHVTTEPYSDSVQYSLHPLKICSERVLSFEVSRYNSVYTSNVFMRAKCLSHLYWFNKSDMFATFVGFWRWCDTVYIIIRLDLMSIVQICLWFLFSVERAEPYFEFLFWVVSAPCILIFRFSHGRRKYSAACDGGCF
jgi:hypothetical protein